MVIYRGADGKPGYHQTDDIHDAVMYVESLRNDKDVDHARIFRLDEVTFEYRPYYRVELSSGAAASVSAGNDGVSDSAGDDEVVVTTEVEDGDDESGDDGDDTASSDNGGADEGSDDEDDDVPEESVEAGGARRGLFGR
ncbi:MAG: hypothetical protein KJN63_07935 [Acidimicrobiia bacterium]|nr:hypothetical protein [Acidimicrobiia bacterium]